MTDLLLLTSRRDDHDQVAVIGPLDHHTAREFRARIGQLLDEAIEPPQVVVNLRCCTNADVHGLLVLADARHAAEVKGGLLHLEGVPPLIERLIRAEGMADRLLSARPDRSANAT
jgi:anti-anti-sigma factor